MLEGVKAGEEEDGIARGLKRARGYDSSSLGESKRMEDLDVLRMEELEVMRRGRG
jgi:hypothetical protein